VNTDANLLNDTLNDGDEVRICRDCEAASFVFTAGERA
jgi:hypothetical protein